MTSIPLTIRLNDVTYSGDVDKVLIRTEDVTIRTLKDLLVFVDPEDPTYDSGTKVGANLVPLSDADWFINGTDIVVAADSAWNNAKVFQTTGATHHMTVRGVANTASYTVIAALTITAAVDAALTAFNLGNRYAWSVFNIPLSTFIAGLQLDTASGIHAGWTFNPLGGVSGNPVNYFFDAGFGATRPVVGVPFIIAIQFDRPSLTSKFYFNNPVTPVGTHVHLAGDAGDGDGAYEPLSFGPGSGIASWEGNAGKFLVHRDSNPDLKMTDTQRIGIFNEWKTKYGIV